MNNIEKLISERGIPELLRFECGEPVRTVADFEKRREEIKTLLQQKEYGYIPPKPEHFRVEVTEDNDKYLAGKATKRSLMLYATLGGKEFSFPATSVIPNGEGKHPVFVHINFRDLVPDVYQPTEEIIDRGYACFSFGYKDVTSDDGDFKDKCAPYLLKSRRAKTATGKIAMWSWTAMRVMDYIETLDCIDLEHVAVIGHSGLGKTALLTAAFDERFKYAISNDSGCSGAALSRGNTGETVEVINRVFPFWFCPDYNDAAKNGRELEFDQHFLMALTVPRHVIVGSAKEDLWADPTSEFLGLAAVNPAYAIYGMKGLVHNDEIPTAKSYLGEGDSCYQVRFGTHYLSREDWHAYMNFIDSKRG